MVSPPDQHSANRLPIFSRHRLFSGNIDQLDKADAPLIPEACPASSHTPTASRGIPFLFTTPSRSKNHPRAQPRPCMHQAHSIMLPETKPARAGLKNVLAMLNAGWLALLVILFFLFTTLSDSTFGRAADARRCLTAHVTRSLLPSSRPHTQRASSMRSMNRNTSHLRYASPSHLRDSRSVWRITAAGT